MEKPWSADFHITKRLVHHLLASLFPELEVRQIRQFSMGWDNVLYEVNGNLLFRFPRRQIAVPLINMENRLLPHLVSLLPAMIPNPTYIGEPTELFPYPFLGYSKLAGTVPYQWERTNGLVLSNDCVNKDREVQLAEQWSLFLKALHHIPADDAAAWGAASSDEIGRMNINKRKPLYIEKVNEAYEKNLVDSKGDLLAIVPHLSTHLSPSARPACLVHGDLNFRNFLLDRYGGLAAVIDWGDAHIGDPAADLSVIYSFLSPSARWRFFASYGDISKETQVLARFRALYTNLTILLYADDIGDVQQFNAAKKALKLCCEM